MKYIKGIDFSIKDDGSKQLIVKITEKEMLEFDDIYLLIESYKSKVDAIILYSIDGKNIEVTFSAEKINAYDIKKFLEKLI